eukprot:TRINITY_DN3303_c0_g1_i1.p1 TRINITY_DN3303_c0_g1~~TRINITY_DN3303_c0_g1_i1.p1  ORF type:complete len:394 (+),score=152.22 TRINITY_DN3303_c0_g1_i1:83-1183(+)
MQAQEPDIKPFTYCLLPCDKEAPITEVRYEGTSDQELRDRIASHFGTHGITAGQRDGLRSHLAGEVQKQQEKEAEKAKQEPSTAEAAEQEKRAAALLDQAVQLQGGSFEIVPVTYPDHSNGYIGTSLYIDQVGRFKDLPLNERASAMSQRDIRGDAFVLRNYDDPVQDAWARLDCFKAEVEEMVQHPPAKSEDPTARARAMQAGGLTTVVTAEMVGKAREARQQGNDVFREGKAAEAERFYTTALGELHGRLDEVDQEEVAELKRACLLNRAQCRLKQNKLAQAEADCSMVLEQDPRVLKALYRRATARRMAKDFDGAQADLAVAREVAPSDPDVQKAIDLTERDRRQHQKREKERYAAMFGSGSG